MNTFFSELFLYLLGLLYLLIRYRNFNKMKEVKNEKYGGSYSNAGRAISLNVFIILLAILIVGGIVAVVISPLS